MSTTVAFPSSQTFAIRVRLYGRGTPFVHIPKLTQSTPLIQDVRPLPRSPRAEVFPFSSRLQRSEVLQRKVVAKHPAKKRHGLLGSKLKRH